MLRYLKKITPAFAKRYIKRIINYFNKKVDHLQPKNYTCPVCNNNVSKFKRLPDEYFEKLFEVRTIHSIFQTETINLLNYSCPNCGASDRDRLYALFLQRNLNKNISYNLIDFAPTQLANFIKDNFPNINYRSADLYMDNVDDKVDITNMNIYDAEQFDIFICSHILEHIEDDIKALEELYRILKKDGWGILMVPINLGLTEIYENPEIKTEDERWKHFGQNDHVRRYSKDGFIKRVESVGFKIKQHGVDYFGEDVFNKYGIHKYSVLYIVSK